MSIIVDSTRVPQQLPNRPDVGSALDWVESLARFRKAGTGSGHLLPMAETAEQGELLDFGSLVAH